MTAIVQPASAGGGGGGVANAQNVRGSITGLAPTATQTLVSTTVGSRKLRGFKVHGTTDGEAWVELDAVPLAGIRERLSRVIPAYVVMPNPEVLSAGATLALRVRNEGVVSGDYEGTLFAE